MGTYGDSAGATKCLSCDAATYADKPGSASCLSCPTPTSSEKGSSTCDSCIDNYYPNPRFDDGRNPVDGPAEACQECDEFGSCYGDNLPIPDVGYWCV